MGWDLQMIPMLLEMPAMPSQVPTCWLSLVTKAMGIIEEPFVHSPESPCVPAASSSYPSVLITFPGRCFHHNAMLLQTWLCLLIHMLLARVLSSLVLAPQTLLPRSLWRSSNCRLTIPA